AYTGGMSAQPARQYDDFPDGTEISRTGVRARDDAEDARDVAIMNERDGEESVPWEQFQAELRELEAQGR
ncbi:MAG: hypothetical protein ACRDPW_04805, partial [Mycobacteriales bacterium]